MKLTLLELVQDMLVATDSENVSSVGETEDAGMCVNIANREFEKLISKLDPNVAYVDAADVNEHRFGKRIKEKLTNEFSLNFPEIEDEITPENYFE